MPLKKNVLKLLENQDKKTPVSVDLISQRLGYSRREVKDALRELEKKGKIETVSGQNQLLFFKKD
ncbi:hypothetical protein C9439_05890 [archaeon SCG-AAA382B04]|nr:hypothetical protein C9439_05890 [archaeon SCG-AAA382B04]